MIAVVGSVNLDTVIEVASFPRPGETVLARRHSTSHGGKGANQAVAAARLGSDVSFIGAVGGDAAGAELVESLESEGIDCRHVARVRGPSGVAIVVVDDTGENSIMVSQAANAAVAVDTAAEALADARVVLCQLEIPLDAARRASEIATGTVIVNAAPARRLPPDVLDLIDILIVNQLELRTIAGSDDHATVRSLGIGTVVTTLGRDGAQVVTPGDVAYLPALDVDPADTTGAGDAFCGAFASAIDAGLDVFDAAAHGVVAGSLATTRVGARTGMPDRERLERELVRRR